MQQIETPVENQYEQLNPLPVTADHCRVLDFEKVELKQIEKGFWVVKVKGRKPHAHMKVELVPAMHVHQPEYWDIKVHGCVNADIDNPKSTPFEVTLPLTACKGVKGIEIVGGTKASRFDIPGA